MTRQNKSSFTVWRNRRKWNPTRILTPYNSLDVNNGGDPAVIQFINNFYARHTGGDVGIEVLRKTFMSGYCWYFAHMLKLAFDSGEVCWCAPFGHFVWCNEYKGRDYAYDVEGVSIAEADHYIPEYYLGDLINAFKHASSKDIVVHKPEIDAVIHKYLVDIGEQDLGGETHLFSS